MNWCSDVGKCFNLIHIGKNCMRKIQISFEKLKRDVMLLIMSLLHLAFLRNLKRDSVIKCHEWIPAIPDTLLSNMYQYELWFGQRDFFGLGSSFTLFSEGKLKWNLKAPPKKLC